ncbi:MAG: UDP-2,3-diacylglucosamine diphosphatase [Gammaproteobacteria bacterium]|nr:UDP-2,3-diacylglucosamine diphosphatase [Gammaproteobacteria bacterium]MDE2022698.1 UDP-2,3-diacylglucosamine diphosphatase [Gammaproteobacteria bacterium]
MTTLFISDLHLDAARPRITQLFLQFLQTEARRAQALYILGDFFEAWIGDDDPDPHHAEVIAAVAALTATDVPVYFIHGNRDFLIGPGFIAKTGCTLLADPTRVELYGTPTLIMHGDILCTDDLQYQTFRRQVRDPTWQKEFLAKPLTERRAIAKQARAHSQIQTASKPDYLMDVNQREVERVMLEHQVTRLIHGHTHRPAVHRFSTRGRDLTRIVLGDWYTQSSVLRAEPGTLRLQDTRCPTTTV